MKTIDMEDELSRIHAKYCNALNDFMRDHSLWSIESSLIMNRGHNPEINCKFFMEMTPKVKRLESTLDETYYPVNFAGIVEINKVEDK
jgi:hypothetical protein